MYTIFKVPFAFRSSGDPPVYVGNGEQRCFSIAVALSNAGCVIQAMSCCLTCAKVAAEKDLKRYIVVDVDMPASQVVTRHKSRKKKATAFAQCSYTNICHCRATWLQKYRYLSKSEILNIPSRIAPACSPCVGISNCQSD